MTGLGGNEVDDFVPIKHNKLCQFWFCSKYGLKKGNVFMFVKWNRTVSMKQIVFHGFRREKM